MVPLALQCRRSEPLFTDGQWLAIGERLQLSRRGRQIVRLVFEEAQEESIAAELGISANTVHTHLQRLYEKLGVTSRLGLVLRVVREHLAALQEAKHIQPALPLRFAARRAA